MMLRRVCRGQVSPRWLHVLIPTENATNQPTEIADNAETMAGTGQAPLAADSQMLQDIWLELSKLRHQMDSRLDVTSTLP